MALLFGEGDEPEGLDGELEGQIVGKLFGIPEAALANPLMKIDPTWRGKSFDSRAGTGLNRLSPIAAVVMPIITAGYLGLRHVDGEMEGFHFEHAPDIGLIEPRVRVRALDYGVPDGDVRLIAYFALRRPVGSPL